MNAEEIKANIAALKMERETYKVRSEGGKISSNGVYGKLGSPYSPLFAPNMMVAVTLTGQLSVLMFIEDCELAAIPVVSANTDGVTVLCPRAKEAEFQAIVRRWEERTGFQVEQARYRALYSSSVNSYLAVKEDGKCKRKGPMADPWTDGDLRAQLSKNPQMTACSHAVMRKAVEGVPLEETIAALADPRMFVTAIKVNGGAVWRGHYLGRVVRYYWSTDGEPILYKDGGKKVSKTDGARPLMVLDGRLPPDLDRGRYVAEAEKLAAEIGMDAGLMK